MRKAVGAIAVLGIGLCAVVYLFVRLGDAAVGYAQAQAQIETARAAQVASAGLSSVAVINALLLLVLFVFLVAVVLLAAYLVVVERVKHQSYLVSDRHRWISGPNAQWQRLGSSKQIQLLAMHSRPVEYQEMSGADVEEVEDVLSLAGWGF